MEQKLNKIKERNSRKHPFKVPENYFEQFNAEIMSKLPEKKHVAPRKVTMWEKAKPWVYMAAMFMGMYVMINFMVSRNEPQTPPMALQSETQQQQVYDASSDDYWSTVQMTEDDFYQILEDQIDDDTMYDLLSDEVYL